MNAVGGISPEGIVERRGWGKEGVCLA